MGTAFGVDQVVQIAVLLRRRDRDHSLMGSVPGKPVQFGPLQKSYWHTKLPALRDNALQTQIMTFLGQADPLEGAAACLDGFADRVKTVDVVHGMVSVMLAGGLGECSVYHAPRTKDHGRAGCDLGTK